MALSLTTFLTNLANTVRALTGKSDKIVGNEIIAEIQNNLEKKTTAQEKIATPSKSIQYVTPDSGYKLTKVTVGAVTSAIDSNIAAGNIKKGVAILGVTGTYDNAIEGAIDGVELDEGGTDLYINNSDYIVHITDAYDVYLTDTEISTTITGADNAVYFNGTAINGSVVYKNDGGTLLENTTYNNGLVVSNGSADIEIFGSNRSVYLNDTLNVDVNGTVNLSLAEDTAKVNAMNLSAENIKSGVTILGVTGTAEDVSTLLEASY